MTIDELHDYCRYILECNNMYGPRGGLERWVHFRALPHHVQMPCGVIQRRPSENRLLA